METRILTQAGASSPAFVGLPALDSFLGENQEWNEAIEEARGEIASDEPMCISGESGVGKWTLARTLHAAGPRGRSPIRRVFAGREGTPRPPRHELCQNTP